MSAEISDDNGVRAMLIEQDTSGLAQALALYGPRLRRTIRLRLNRQICSRIDESDVLQETYLSAAQELSRYLASPTVPVFIWLHHLTVERIADLHRMHLAADKRTVNREVISIDELASDLSGSAWALCEALTSQLKSPSSEAMQAERQLRLLESLKQLKEVDREVLLLRHFEMLSNVETAAALDLSPTAANNRYVRALERLTKMMSDEQEHH